MKLIEDVCYCFQMPNLKRTIAVVEWIKWTNACSGKLNGTFDKFKVHETNVNPNFKCRITRDTRKFTNCEQFVGRPKLRRCIGNLIQTTIRHSTNWQPANYGVVREEVGEKSGQLVSIGEHKISVGYFKNGVLYFDKDAHGKND